jgi:hypothetical protein
VRGAWRCVPYFTLFAAAAAAAAAAARTRTVM